MTLHIRPFEDEDYEAMVEVANRLFPDHPESVEEAQSRDRRRDPNCRFRRFVADRFGMVVGYAEYDQAPSMYHPQKFEIGVYVDPNRQRKGIGTALFDYLMMDLDPFDPLSLRSVAREDDAASVRFLTKRGFAEMVRSWESHLDVPSFDFSPYAELGDKVAQHGITLATLGELAADPARDRKLYELDLELLEDVPFPDERTRMSFEHFKRRFLHNPNLLSDAYCVAIDGDRYVGVSSLWASQASPDELYTGLTGVRRDYRRRGLALALKLKTIQYAAEHNFRTIKALNASANRPILALNERLGYVKQLAWMTFAKDL
ncbi:MAG: GNAT family N-acetyltransferase [Candidatus Bipolaricaulia bacterium]